MSRHCLFIQIIFLLFYATLSAKIIPISNIEDSQGYFEGLDSQSLVLWDVDETLIIPSDQVLHPENHMIRKALIQHYMGNLSKEKFEEFVSQILSRTPYCLINHVVPHLISSLQNQGIHVMAFTAMGTGNYGSISSLEDWRIQQLRKLGIDFSRCFPQHSGLSWKETISTKGFPAFKDGILCSDHLEKGPVLHNFLHKIQWKPAQVLFFDDLLDCLISVEQALETLNIPFIGFHYQASQLKLGKPPVDLKLAHYKFQFLVQNGIWLPDEEALFMLQNVPAEAGAQR